MKVLFFALTVVLALASVGCCFRGVGGSEITKERKALEETVAAHVFVGMPKEELLRFFESRGWDAVYGPLNDAYSVRLEYPSKGWDYVVTITVWLENGERVKGYKVVDNYIAP